MKSGNYPTQAKGGLEWATRQPLGGTAGSRALPKTIYEMTSTVRPARNTNQLSVPRMLFFAGKLGQNFLKAAS